MNNTKNQSRKCKSCHEELKGRIDKIYCSDHCRNSHNNSINRDQNNEMRRINSILRKNRRILKRLRNSSKKEFLKQDLIYSGFDFKYFTSIQTDEQNNEYIFCYDEVVKNTRNSSYLLVNQRDITSLKMFTG